MDIQNTIQKLRVELNQHNYNYYVLDKPINSDYDVISIHCDDSVDLKMAKVVGKIDNDF